MAQIAHLMLKSTIDTIEATTPDDRTISENFAFSSFPANDDVALPTDFRTFFLMDAVDLSFDNHLDPQLEHPRNWRMSFPILFVYPYIDASNKLEVTGIAIDDAAKLIHELETNATQRATLPNAQWTGILAEYESLSEPTEGILFLTLSVTILFERHFS